MKPSRFDNNDVTVNEGIHSIFEDTNGARFDLQIACWDGVSFALGSCFGCILFGRPSQLTPDGDALMLFTVYSLCICSEFDWKSRCAQLALLGFVSSILPSIGF